MGLWSTLGKIGKIGANFIPGVGPLVSMGIGAAIGVGTSALAARGKKKKKKGSADDLLGMQQDVGQTSLDFAKRLFPSAEQDIGAASNYLRPLVSGSSQELSEALMPEISAIRSGTDQAIEEMGRFGARGGGQAMGALVAKQQRNAQIAQLISKRRSEAASQIGELGLGQASAATAAARTTVGATSSNLDILTRRRGQTMGMIGAGAEAGGAILARILFGGKGGD